MNTKPNTMPSEAGRTQGLDTLRALAIVLVFMYHYMVFVSGEPTFGWASAIGWVGVDLFFVLSGYLIGNQLFAGVAHAEQLSLGRFYARRALRTWPAFWVVLAAYVLFPAAMGGKTPPPLWRFLTFTQNLGLQPGTAFSHAWSLCIEEQFYFVLPLALLAALRVGSRKAQAWVLLGALVLLGIGARWWFWNAYGRETSGQLDTFYTNVYYGTLCRFDEFLPGVAIALLRNAHPQHWRRVVRHGRALLAAGVIATLLMLAGAYHLYYIEDYGYGFFMSVFGYSLIAMAFGLLVLAALSPASPLHRWRVPGAASLAMWSYSIYLSHKPVAHIVQGLVKANGLPSWMILPGATASSLLAGVLLYRAVEAPFMHLRERHFPSNFVATPLRAGPRDAAF